MALDPRDCSSSSCSSGGSDEDQLHPFTEDDERRELVSLSVHDIESASADLLGITTAMASLGVEKGGGGSDITGAAMLRKLDGELAKMRRGRKSAYLEAQAGCPEQVDVAHREAFLLSEGMDEKRAAKRLVKYWERRSALFGPEKCFLPLTLKGALRDDHLAILNCIYCLLPAPDQYGRRILFFDVRNYDRSKPYHSTDALLRATWYTLEVALEDPRVRRHGLVIMGYPRYRDIHHINPKLARGFFRLLCLLPLTLRSVHICRPSPVAMAAGPIMKRFLGKKFRLRVLFHVGSEEKVTNELHTFGIPRDRVPVEIGGDVVMDQVEWMNERVVLEDGSCFAPWWKISQDAAVHGLDQFERLVENGERAVKRLRGEQGHGSVDMVANATHSINTSSSPPPKSFSNEAAEGKRKGRNVGDPRMNRAVEAKLASPLLSHHDALVAGGFVFMDGGSDAAAPFLSDKEIFDADNVSLAQRKNQLGRRYRKAVKKRQGSESCVKRTEENIGNSPIAVDHDTADIATDDVSMLVNAHPDAATRKHPSHRVNPQSPDKSKDPTFSTSDSEAPEMLGRASPNACHKGEHLERRDSFYDSILELPGIQGLEME